jgi:hypothetical protein
VSDETFDVFSDPFRILATWKTSGKEAARVFFFELSPSSRLGVYIYIFGSVGRINFFLFLGGVQALVRPIWEMFLVKKKVNAIFFTALGFG